MMNKMAYVKMLEDSKELLGTESEYYRLCFVTAFLLISHVTYREDCELFRNLIDFRSNDLTAIKKASVMKLEDLDEEYLREIDKYFDKLLKYKNLIITKLKEIERNLE